MDLSLTPGGGEIGGNGQYPFWKVSRQVMLFRESQNLLIPKAKGIFREVLIRCKGVF